MSKDEAVVEFLKCYAGLCHNERYFKDFAPFYSKVSMPGGYAGILDKNSNMIGSFDVEHDPDNVKFEYSPSMPVNPISIAFLNFVVAAMNAYAEQLQEKDNGDA